MRQDLYGWVEGTSIPNKLTAVCWLDGAIVQLSAIFSEIQRLQDEKDKIISNKNSAVCTAVEQPCDLSQCFISLRKLANTTICSNIPSIGLQEKIKRKLAELKESGELSLMSIKESALLDFLSTYPFVVFLSTYPSVVARECSTESIADIFFMNEMIDTKSLSRPAITKILRTCKKKLSVNTYQATIHDKFDQLYHDVSNKGHISDNFLLSIIIATDANCYDIRCYHTSPCETFQRLKSLSHIYQRELRLLATEIIVSKKKEKMNKVCDKLKKLHKLNDKAVQSLILFLPRPYEKSEFGGTTMVHLFKINIPELKSFIHV